MKIPTMPILLVVALASWTPVMADTFVLNDGSKIDGRLIKQDESSYVIEIQVTPSIKDERVVAKEDVERIEKSKSDEAAFRKIRDLVPTPDGLDAGDYRKRIDQASRFIRKYPDSPKMEEVMQMLSVLRRELREVDQGGVKLSGMIYTAEDIRMNQYEMDARIEAMRIKQLIDKGNMLQALRSFDEFEDLYTSTVVYEQLLPDATAAVGVYMRDISRMLSTYNDRVKQRHSGLERMSSQDRRASELAIQEQAEVLFKRLDLQKKAKMAWVTPHPFCKPALDDAMRACTAKLKKLESATAKARVDAGKIYRDGMLLAKQGAGTEALAEVLIQAKAAGMPESYMERLQVAAAEKPAE